MNNDVLLEPQRLTSPTVKVRRLGYLIVIPLIVQDKEIPISALKKSVLDWAKENHTFFKHYSIDLPVRRLKKRLLTGEIKTLSGAGRYINTCEELGLIVRMKGFRVSKIGKAISALSTDGNPFELSIGQLFLILKLLLEKDYDCLSILFKILSTKVRDETDFFQKEMERKLHEKAEKATEMNKLYLVDRLRKRIESIRNWKKARRYYLENIKAPRLEWMLDLKFLKHWDQRTDTFDFQNHVERFFNMGIISYEWLQDGIPPIFGDFYYDLFKKGITYWTNFPREDRLGLLNDILTESMEKFKTGAELGKISADEFFEYSLAFLIQKKSIVTSLSKLEKDLVDFITSGKLQYRYVRTVSKADRGYITKL